MISLKRIIIVVIIVYFIVTCYTGYLLLSKNSISVNNKISSSISFSDNEDDWNPWGEELQSEGQRMANREVQAKNAHKWSSNKSLDFGKHFHRKTDESGEKDDGEHGLTVEIWGKAAIGLYLWEHIFNGKLEKKMDGIWSYGFKKIDNIKFKFRTGPGVILSKVPTDVTHLVLAINVMSPEKIQFARAWLDFLPHLLKLKFLILVVLGSEQCKNDWLISYMSYMGGLVNNTFLIYDSPLVDNKNFFQWPLGVATYRNFPLPDYQAMDLNSPRPFTCNFLGTIYPKSSREKLLHVLSQNNLSKSCHIKVRQQWQPAETEESLNTYLHSLRLSDLTLSPNGMNSECYRIYEAMSMGSIPVVEDVMTPGKCGDSERTSSGVHAPLRLLKAYDAPIIYVKDWKELKDILEKENLMSVEDKIERRVKLVKWYEQFRFLLRDKLVGLIKDSLVQKPILETSRKIL